VNFEELDIALEELETRLERLRALYEQYFLGFEKIEPSVARKDVDRRIYLLRREKIRNTGKRFKMQTIIQRYNTFQQYWQRICREIENGTYKRHLARAERIMGADQLLTIAARRRFGRATVESLAANAEVAEVAAAADDASPLDEIEAGDLAVRDPFPPELGGDRSPLPAIPRSPTPTRLPTPGTVPPSASPLPARPSKYESLSLDMDFLDSWDPETSIRSRNPGSVPKPASEPAPRPAPAPAALETKRAPIEEPSPPRSLPKAAPPPRPVARPVAVPASDTSLPKAAPLPKPSPEAAAPAAASAPKAAPPPKPAPRVTPPATPERAVPRPAAPPPVAKSTTLSDARIKELHENLVRIKRENKEAGQVSVESLAKTLRATEEKLRAEHKNRRIEFEVVLRDGKAVVKPKVR
jgi:hypothetical protein